MATTLKTKNSVTTTVVPTTLAQGELAVNIADKKVWVGNAATTPVQIVGSGSGGGGAAGSNTQVQYNSSGALAGSVNLTFDGTDLTLGGGVNVTRAIKFINTTTAPAGASIFAPTGNTIAFSPNGAEAMRIDSSNNVGIGTNSPSGRLDVVNTTTPYLNITATAISTSAVLCLNATSGGQEAITYQQALRFGTATGVNATGFAERMRISSSGNVIVGGTTATGRFTIKQGGGDGFGSSLALVSNTSTNNWQMVIGGDNTLYIGYNATTAATLNSGGNLALKGANSSANGTGITFPVTQSASIDANTLDDYEEGGFTPSVTASSGVSSGGTYTGSYIKIGRLVYVSMNLTNVGKNTMSGQVNVSGLPFDVSVVNATASMRWSLGGGSPPSGATILCPQASGGTGLELQFFSNAAYLGNLNATNLATTFDFYNITFTYITSN